MLLAGRAQALTGLVDGRGGPQLPSLTITGPSFSVGASTVIVSNGGVTVASETVSGNLTVVGSINVSTFTTIVQVQAGSTFGTTFATCIPGSTITLNIPYDSYVNIQIITPFVTSVAADWVGVGVLWQGGYLDSETSAAGLDYSNDYHGVGTLKVNYTSVGKVTAGSRSFCLTFVSNNTTNYIGTTGPNSQFANNPISIFRVSTVK